MEGLRHPRESMWRSSSYGRLSVLGDTIDVLDIAIGILGELIIVPIGIACYQKGWCLYFGTTVICNGQAAIMKAKSGGEETPLNAIRPCGMEVPPNETLDTS